MPHRTVPIASTLIVFMALLAAAASGAATEADHTAARGGAAGDAAAGMPGLLLLAGSEEPGVRLTVAGSVVDPDGDPVAGAELVVYQTDHRGWYTPEKVMDEPHARLKGRLTTGPDGIFEIRTIRPGPYPATEATPENRRIPEHVHINVSAPGFSSMRLQMVFRDDPRMTPYWHEWARRGGHPVVDVERAGDGSQGARLEIVIRRR